MSIEKRLSELLTEREIMHFIRRDCAAEWEIHFKYEGEHLVLTPETRVESDEMRWLK